MARRSFLTLLHGSGNSWPDLMLASYKARNPQQAAWLDSNPTIQTEFLARLSAPAGYLYTTFGPAGQNKAVCDFVYLFRTTGNITTRTNTKSGAALRWNVDGTVYVQTNLPTHTLGAGAGIVTVSSTDGWSGVTIFDLNTNNFDCPFPQSIVTAMTGLQQFYINRNQFSGTWTVALPATLLYFYIYNNQFSGAWTVSLPATLQNFLIYNNGLSQAAVDSVLLQIYTQRASFTFASPLLQIHGTNAAPSGVYQYAATPTTGKEMIYALVNDTDAEGFNKWTILYNS